MIVFVTTRAHADTVASLRDGRFGAALPRVAPAAWEDLWHARRVPRATYVLTDLERLSAWELVLAARFYRRATAAGLRCLNDPARVRLRHGLLVALHAAGINPFTAHRAEALPRPRRFPVFLRGEADHGMPLSGLLADQAALDATLAALPASGMPLRHLLVIEFCAEPIAPGAWRKYGTFRIGGAMHLDHAVIEDTWLVKTGTMGLATDAMFEAEREAVAANAYADGLAPAFDLAAIEYGRADHATVAGREVVYEINTNPNIYPLARQRSPVRDEAQAIARRRFARLLAALDDEAGGQVAIEPVLEPGWRRHGARLGRRLGFSPDRGRPI